MTIQVVDVDGTQHEVFSTLKFEMHAPKGSVDTDEQIEQFSEAFDELDLEYQILELIEARISDFMGSGTAFKGWKVSCGSRMITL